MSKPKPDAVTILVASLLVVGAFIVGIGIALGLGALQAFILMLLWNFTMPSIFGLPVVGFWKMWAFMVLVNIVIGWLRKGKKE